ncbi:MAG: histidine--tRNA ligase [Dictyoglomus sp. NZ13-RE01]|nr:MAG: histidine--tRNA ligase [Dictyoglomus sp. NZ13-RE01]
MKNLGLPRGVQDILPQESRLWQYIENLARNLFESYNFQEIRTPIFEFTELFIKGTGETTDIVTKEMYTFYDKKGRSLTLRPEGTPGVVRAYLMQKVYAQNIPWKVYYIGPMFRYERPQAGRYRQFHQLGVEVLGIADPIADFEVINVAVEFLQKLNLPNVEVELNSLGCDKCRPNYRKALINYFTKYKDMLSDVDRERLEKNPLRLLDSKEEYMESLKENAPSSLDYLCDDCINHFDKVKNYLRIANINFKLNPKLVRGLDYYTKTVFEITTNLLGSQNAIVGGGRYDNLVETYGGPSIPGLGFALGMERLILLLSKSNYQIKNEKPLIYFAIVDENFINSLIELSKNLKNEFRIELGIPSLSLKNQLKMADKLGARIVVFIDDQIKNGKLKIKDLLSGEEKLINYNGIIKEIKDML